eukprot:3855614-Prymnesium_polylepis.1
MHQRPRKAQHRDRGEITCGLLAAHEAANFSDLCRPFVRWRACHGTLPASRVAPSVLGRREVSQDVTPDRRPGPRETDAAVSQETLGLRI